MQTMVLPNGERLTVKGSADDSRIPEGSCSLEFQRNPPRGTWVEFWLSAGEVAKLVTVLQMRGKRHHLATVDESGFGGGTLVASGRGPRP